MTTSVRSSASLGPLVDFARATRLYLRTLGSPAIAIWFFSALVPAMAFSFATPGRGESPAALLAVGTALVCVGLSLGARVLLQAGQAGSLSFLETRPLRFPLKLLVAAPLFTIAAAYAVVSGAAHHLGAAETAALGGACLWSTEVGLLVPPRASLRLLGWLGLLILGLLAFATARGQGGWRAAAITMGALTSIGWFAIPRRLVSRSPGGARNLPERPDDPRWLAVSRPTPATVGAHYHRRKRRTTWLDVVRVVASGHHPLSLPVLGSQMAFAGIIFAVAIGHRDSLGVALGFWIIAAMSFSGAIASGLSRPRLEFLATRPLGTRRMVWGTIAPWFVLTLSLPVAILAWGPRGSVRFGAASLPVTSLALRLALASVGCLFSSAYSSLRARGERVSIVDVAAWVGFFGIAVPFWFPYRFLRSPWPLPPVWLVGAYAVAFGIATYRRLPPMLLQRRRLTRRPS